MMITDESGCKLKQLKGKIAREQAMYDASKKLLQITEDEERRQSILWNMVEGIIRGLRGYYLITIQ